MVEILEIENLLVLHEVMMIVEDRVLERRNLINIESIVDQVHMIEIGSIEEDQAQGAKAILVEEIEEMVREKKAEKMARKIKSLKLILSKNKRKLCLNRSKKQVSCIIFGYVDFYRETS